MHFAPLAFGFGNLPLLGWLAAAAAPLIIHLWFRNTYREMPWAAMYFLQAAIKRQARRMRLQQWLLLAIRTLLLILVAVAAAKPYLSDFGWVGAGSRVHRVLVIDTSLSMSLSDGNNTRFERAVSLAQQLVAGSRAGESFSLVTMAHQPVVHLAPPVSDRTRLAGEIGALATTYGEADLPATLATVKGLISAADKQGEPYARHEIVCFTDLGKNTWDNAIDGAVDSSDLWQQFGESTRVVVVDLGMQTAVNLAVTRLNFADAFATAGRPLVLESTITNFSDEAREVVAELIVDGASTAERALTIPARATSTLTFRQTLLDEAWHRFEVRLPPDALDADNRHFLAAYLPQSVRVLCVEGRRNAARYLANALDPSAQGVGPLQPTVISVGQLRDTPLDDYRCVLLSNVAQLSSSETAQLREFVEQGGGLALFVGDAVDVDAYNRMAGWSPPTVPAVNSVVATLSLLQAGSQPQARAFLPVRLGAPTNQTTLGIDPLDYSHPIAQMFRGNEAAGLLTTPILRFCPLAKVDPQCQVVFALSDGSPLLVTAPRGQGHVAVCGTAASLDSVDPVSGQPWTLWPAWPSFLPVIRELVDFLDDGQSFMSSLTINSSTQGRVPVNESVSVNRPDQRVDTIVVGTGGEWLYSELDRPGFYDAVATGAGAMLRAIAVNTPAAESDPESVLISDLPGTVELVEASDLLRAGNSGGSSTAWLHRWLLYGVLLLMVFESVLANRWGRAAR